MDSVRGEGVTPRHREEAEGRMCLLLRRNCRTLDYKWEVRILEPRARDIAEAAHSTSVLGLLLRLIS